MAIEKDYVLGTHDDEIARLGLQHRVWRPRVLDAWRRAGFTAGQTLIDLGCGPGHATLDLAEIVGPAGRVIALDRSRRFLDSLAATSASRGLRNIEAHELDLDQSDLPPVQADGAWSRWSLAFVQQPRRLLERLRDRLRPGGALVLHEYLHYTTWRLSPRSREFDEFVAVVTESWRASGGEPDIGLDLPRWVQELGFEVRELRPFLDMVPRSDYVWQWPKAFIEVGVRRMLDLGRLTPEQGEAIIAAFARAELAPGTFMITPALIEVIAVRR